MPLEPIDLLKERLKEMKSIKSNDKKLERLIQLYKLTIDFLELYGFKKEYTSAKLSKEDIKRIKKTYKKGTATKLSYQYNVDRGTILNALNK